MADNAREIAEALYEELRHSSMDAEPTVPAIEAAIAAAVEAEREAIALQLKGLFTNQAIALQAVRAIRARGEGE